MSVMFSKSMKVLAFVTFLPLLGCNQVLYTNLAEKEANEMMVVLMEKGIACEKTYDDRAGLVSIHVNPSDIPQAVSALRDHGFPKEDFTNLGEVFTKNSLVSSPTEEHARYVFAISQDLSKTLSELDGVITAKVHFVLPKPKKSKKDKPSIPTAAVFIKHSAKVDMEAFVPQIKLLIQGSIEGLKYEDINVALFPAVKINNLSQKIWQVKDILSVKVLASSEARLWSIIGSLLALVLILAIACLYLVSNRGSQQANDAGLSQQRT